MAFDYTECAADAEELIQEFGRPVTLVQLEATPDDPAKPWEGAAAPRDAATEVSATGAFVPVSSLKDLGFMSADDGNVRRAQQAVLISAKEVGAANLLEEFHELIDGTKRWRILFVHMLAPGDTRLLYALELKR